MPLIVNRGTGGDFEPAPEGPHPARCCDVRDLGRIETHYPGRKKLQRKILVSWVIDAVRADGKPALVAKRYTASLHEKAMLRADLEAWRGKAFSESELDAFDVETVIGAPVLLNVVHVKKNGVTYANVQSLMPLPRGMQAPGIPSSYVRWVDRDENAAATEEDAPPPLSDDDIPF